MYARTAGIPSQVWKSASLELPEQTTDLYCVIFIFQPPAERTVCVRTLVCFYAAQTPGSDKRKQKEKTAEADIAQKFTKSAGGKARNRTVVQFPAAKKPTL